MKFVPFSKAHKLVSSNGSQGIIAWEYNTENPELNIAKVKIIGRYPDKARKVNRISKMTVMILEGGGELFVEKIKICLGVGDVIEIDPNEKYFWVARPHIVVAIASTPAWNPEQSESVE
jgi:hypothetical protein